MADENIPSLVFCLGSDQEEDKSKRKTLNGHKTRRPARPSVTPGPQINFRSTDGCSQEALLLFTDGFAKHWMATN